MKPFPWRFWVSMFFIVGFGTGLGVGVGAGSALKSPVIGFIIGLVAAILAILWAALWYRRVMRRRTHNPALSFADLNMRNVATIELQVVRDDAFALSQDALSALQGFSAIKVDTTNGIIEGLTGGGSAGYLSFGAPGERLKVAIESANQTMNASRVTIESQPGTLFVIFDFGKNRENINSISTHISKALQRRFDEQREAAERAEMQRALTAAKLSALQAQIEPHFLYNTLANAQSLTRSDPKRADEMLGHLITFLRLSMPIHAAGQIDNEPTSTLGQEVDRVVAYLEIMQIRMGSRLRYAVNVEQPLRQIAFSPLMLQTLVENAIKHGLEPKTGGGNIRIDGTIAGDMLHVAVADDGIGLSTETAGSGIGLKNIRERLKLIHADTATFTLQPNGEKGMVATIKLPIAPKEDQQ